jgi:hypothetical protein
MFKRKPENTNRSFPAELYAEWYRLYDIPELERGKPWHFKYLTVNHIYYPLAQSSGKIFALLKAHKAKGGDRAKKLFQFLNEIGARALGRHLGRVLEMAESSADKWEYTGVYEQSALKGETCSISLALVDLW